jgi:hypothetical protein
VKSSQVRDLARRYATGKLSQESYRSQRRSLIDSITGGGVQLAYREDERAAARPHFSGKLIGIAVLATIVVFAVAVVVVKRSSHGPSTAQAAAAPAAPAAPPPEPGPDLVRTFVEANDWSDGSLQSFERRWGGLGIDAQSSAKDSLMYPRLVSGVRQQIDSEKAVASGAGDAHLVELQKMAKTLGIPAS